MTDDADDSKVAMDPVTMAAFEHVLEAIALLPPEARSEAIDKIMETYCPMCAECLDEEGECPEGCDPEDMLDDEDDEDDEDEDEDEEEGSDA